MTSWRFMMSLLLLLTMSGVFPGGVWASAAAGFDVSRPDSQNPETAFRLNLKPGGSMEDRIIIRNTSDAVLKLRVYSADSAPTTNGEIDLKKPDDQMTGLGLWIKLDAPEVVEIAPGENRSIWFKLTIPRDAEPQEQVGGIVVEQTAGFPAARVEIPVRQRPPGPANIKLDIVEFRRTTGSWSRPALFGLTLKNTGNMLLKPTGRVDVSSIFGSQTGSIELDGLPTIFPGQTAELTLKWEQTPLLGYFFAQAVMEYDQDQAESERIHLLVFPWWLIFVAIALLVLWRLVRRTETGKPVDKEPVVESVVVTPAAEKPTPKAKTADVEKPTPKKRGRPPKAKTAEKPAPKKRGRPPKAKADDVEKPKPKKRGRPPKAKTEASEKATTEKPAPKKRGRPPKAKTEAAKKSAAEKPAPKKRGRPPKAKADDVEKPKPKKRGRPPKAKTETSEKAAPKKPAAEKPAPKKRGRPPKAKTETAEKVATEKPAPKKRGRPPKAKTDGTPTTKPAPKKRGRPPKKTST